jgi:hypothetical protein
VKDKENVLSYFLRVDEIIKTIRGLGENVEEQMNVKTVLRYLFLIFDAKVFSIK